MSLFTLGALSTARTHLEQAIALDDPQWHSTMDLSGGRDYAVYARNFAAVVLWLLGFRTADLVWKWNGAAADTIQEPQQWREIGKEMALRSTGRESAFLIPSDGTTAGRCAALMDADQV